MKPLILRSPPWNGLRTGAGTTIVVLDSGFAREHPVLRHFIPFLGSARSFTGGDPLTDILGHGTEACSILVAATNNIGSAGLLPAVTLHIGQVIGYSGMGTVQALCAALRWAININADVIAIPSCLSQSHIELDELLGNVAENGTLIIAPVGNPHANQHGPLYPASHPEVISVGCLAYLDAYLGWSQPPDIVVPAHNIPIFSIKGNLKQIGGTSCATMLIASFFCLLIEQYDRRLAKNFINSSRQIEIFAPWIDDSQILSNLRI